LRSSSPKDVSRSTDSISSGTRRRISLGIECDGSDIIDPNSTAITDVELSSEELSGVEDAEEDSEDSDSSSERLYSARDDIRYNQSISRRLRLLSRTTPPDEDEIFASPSCKLFEFTDNCWTMCGSGDVKFLKHREEGITGGQIRIVMRNASVR